MPVVPADQVQPSWATYVSWEDDVRPWLQMTTLAGPANTDVPAKLQRITDMACEWVQNYLGRPVAPTVFKRKFSGTQYASGSRLPLPYYPILSIESVVETWGMNGQHELVYQTADAQGGAGEQMYQVDWVHGTLVRSYQGMLERPWFPGTNNIEVEWTAGFNPVPQDIAVATLELIQYWWRNTQEATRTFGGVSSEYDSGSGLLWPAVPNRITMMLSAYVQQGIG